MPCLDALARVQMNMELYKDSAGTAAQMAAQEPDAKARAQAEFREGLAYFRLYFAQTEGEGAIDKDPKHAANSLKQAETVLKQERRTIRNMRPCACCTAARWLR